MPAVSVEAATAFLRSSLPPGVVDTRPAGVRVIDIREAAVALGLDSPEETRKPDERPIDTQWVKDRFRAVDAPTSHGTVPVPAGFEVRNGVLDTRPKGLPLVDDALDDVEAHLAGAVLTGPALPLFPATAPAAALRWSAPAEDPASDPRYVDDGDLFVPVVEPTVVDRAPSRNRRPGTASIPLLGPAIAARADAARADLARSDAEAADLKPWIGHALPARPRPALADLGGVDTAIADDLDGADPVVERFENVEYVDRSRPTAGAPGRAGNRYGSAASWMAPGAPTFESILGAGAAAAAAASAASVEVPVAPAPAARPRSRAAAAESENSPFVRRSELRKREGSRTARKAPTSSLSVPRVGIASALGLATIAAPLTGVLSMPTDTPTLPQTAILAQTGLFAQPVPAFPQVSVAPVAAVEDARLVTDESLDPAVPEALAAPRTLLVTKASRSNERSVLPGCSGTLPAGIDSATNGQLPKALLCTLWDKDFSLRADAAVAFAKLNVAYNQRFGHDLCIVDAYRTLQEQYTIKRLRGGFAATPGTSEHGWGLAVDLCGGSSLGGTPTYTWLRVNGPLYGWDNPDWARPGGSGPHEDWHWEYIPGEKTGPGGGE